MVLQGFLAASYFFAVVLISIEAHDQPATCKLDGILKAGVRALGTPAQIPKHLNLTFGDVDMDDPLNGKFWDVFLAVTDLLNSMPNNSADTTAILKAACNWVKESTAAASVVQFEFDCEDYSSWSALAAMIRVINDTKIINNNLNLGRNVSNWKACVRERIAGEPNNLKTLVNNTLKF